MNNYPQAHTHTRCDPLEAWAAELEEHYADLSVHWEMLRMSVTRTPPGDGSALTDVWAPKRPRSRSTRSPRSPKKTSTTRTRSKRTKPDVKVEVAVKEEAPKDARTGLVRWNDEIIDMAWLNSLAMAVAS